MRSTLKNLRDWIGQYFSWWAIVLPPWFFLFLSSGLPYLNVGTNYIEMDKDERTGRQQLIRCSYAGLPGIQGHQEVTLYDTRTCPGIMFLPNRTTLMP